MYVPVVSLQARFRLDGFEDSVELVIGLALAVTFRELRVDEDTTDCDLEGALFRALVDPSTAGHLAAKLISDEGDESGSEAAVASSSSIFDGHDVIRVRTAEIVAVAAIAAVAHGFLLWLVARAGKADRLEGHAP